MGASGARKSRRAQSGDSDAPRKRTKLNRGRQEYRQVTRTARRPQKDEDVEDEIENQESLESEQDTDDEETVVDDKGKAYSALLALLDTEQYGEEDDQEGAEEVQGQETQEESDEEGENGKEDEGHVAGFVEDEDEESEDEETDEESENEDTEDPFEYHFANAPQEYLNKCVSALDENRGPWKTIKSTTETHSCVMSLPPVDSSSKYKSIPKNSLLDSYNVKNRVLESFIKNYGPTLDDDISKQIFDPMMSYKDLIFPYVSHTAIDSYRKLYAMHALNHVYKTRDRILKNNQRIALQNERISNGSMKPEDEREFRDQGFTRPKVLILLPTRHQCYRVVQEIIKLCGADQVENQRKFKGQFYDESGVPESKPEDFRDLFEGNTNDFFCLGVKFTRKTVKLYSSFYQSDIIFASPIGLQLILENPDKKKRQTDFLSSIEMLIVDQAHAIELQNWDHILTVLKYLNKIPDEMHDTDFSRVRMWSIDEKAKFFTQSLIFTEYNTPNVNNLLSRSMNIFGKYRFRALISNEESAMFKVGLKIRQIFARFESTSPMQEPDERFNHFKSVIVPSLSKQTGYEDGLLLYIPQYTDFLRVKNYLHNKTSLMFCDVNEYSEQNDLSRSRALFQQGRRKILLYTERLHHYRRFDLKGVKNILMYGVPNNPLFYTEIVSSIGRSVYEEVADLNISTVRAMYSKWDALALERIVGSKRVPVLTHGQNEFYEFR
jgi:U3 small nucleolar RNA-associated protein 25